MEEAKKAYLIDPQQFSTILNQNKSNVPEKLSKISKQKIPINEKFYTYSELYNKYINDESDKRKPLEIVQHIERPQNYKGKKIISSPMRQISRIPKSYRDLGRKIYDKVLHSKELNWDEHGVYLNRKKLGKSNIFDYIRLYTSKKKNIKEPGFAEFKTYLEKFLNQEGSGLWTKYKFLKND
jgi:hypothetical protein